MYTTITIHQIHIGEPPHQQDISTALHCLANIHSTALHWLAITAPLHWKLAFAFKELPLNARTPPQGNRAVNAPQCHAKTRYKIGLEFLGDTLGSSCTEAPWAIV
jgi:hypothetical protein